MDYIVIYHADLDAIKDIIQFMKTVPAVQSVFIEYS